MGCGASAGGGASDPAGGGKDVREVSQTIELQDTGLEGVDTIFKGVVPLLDEIKVINMGLTQSTDEVKKVADPSGKCTDIGDATKSIVCETAEANKGEDGKIDSKFFELPVDMGDLMKGKLELKLPEMKSSTPGWEEMKKLADVIKKIVQNSLAGLQEKMTKIKDDIKTLGPTELTRQAKEAWGSEGFAAMPKISAAVSAGKKNIASGATLGSAFQCLLENIKRILNLMQQGFAAAKKQLEPMLQK